MMRRVNLRVVRGLLKAPCLSFGALLVALGPAAAADPTAEQALKLLPIQREVDFDRPADAELAKCKIKPEKSERASGWIVLGPSGQVLRRFLDTNGDGVVDQWCYYKDGIEVYRDIDGNHNRKADQYRWLNTGGTRWGTDSKEIGRIDAWKTISAEEVTQEVVAALRDADDGRFGRLLASGDELLSLGLGAAKAKEVAAKLRAAPSTFADLARQQKSINARSRWVHFGGQQPGTVPAGTEGSTKDLVVYENVVATVETGGKHDQVYVGTMVQVGGNWRLVDAPQILSGRGGDLTQQGVFFRLSSSPAIERTDAGVPELDEGVRKIMAELEKLDRDIAGAAADALPKLQTKRNELLGQLIAGAKDKADRGQWLRQLADTTSVAVQGGAYPDGLKQLSDLLEKLHQDKEDADLVSYVAYQYLKAQYGASLQEADPDFAKIQATWTEGLKKFVADYPKAVDAPEAMLQLAMAQEFAGQVSDAKTWYGKIVDEYPNSAPVKKAGGARRRLESVGKPMTLRGPSPNAKNVDLAALAGNVVLVHYWATWCEPCKADLKQLKEIHAKYGRKGFTAVGVSFDSNRQTLVNFLKQEPLPWPQVYEDGGLDSRLANEMGVLTLPTMILVDQTGKVVNRNVLVGELEAELKKLLDKPATRK